MVGSRRGQEEKGTGDRGNMNRSEFLFWKDIVTFHFYIFSSQIENRTVYLITLRLLF